MQVQTFPSGFILTNAYVASCGPSKKSVVIDPAPESGLKILSFIKTHQLELTDVLLTHSHLDHIADVAFLKDQTQAKVWIHLEDAENLRHPGSDKLPLPFPIQGVEPDAYLTDGQSIQIGNMTFKVIHTPGHSPGGVCFYEEKNQVLFSGDTLFRGTIGSLAFPTARPDKMWPSLEKLAKLPKETVVYPGHGESTTISAESRWLPLAKNIFGS